MQKKEKLFIMTETVLKGIEEYIDDNVYRKPGNTIMQILLSQCPEINKEILKQITNIIDPKEEKIVELPKKEEIQKTLEELDKKKKADK